MQEGPYLARQLAFCSKINVFQGEIDIQTPYEDVLALRSGCEQARTPLASFHGYAHVGHAFSPRTGLKSWHNTDGPIEAQVLQDIAQTAQLLLR